MNGIPGPTINRLILYHNYLDKLLRKNDDNETISSVQLGRAVGVSATQVRKDLSYCGPLGCRGIGYEIGSLKNNLGKIIGFDKKWPAALIGAGNLGRALVYYEKFKELGLNIVEIFDYDLNKIGNMVNGVKVSSTKNMVKIIRDEEIRIAILTVPADSAQEVAEKIINAGIKAIWNFAPVPLDLDDEVIVFSEDLSAGIGNIFFQLKKLNE